MTNEQISDNLRKTGGLFCRILGVLLLLEIVFLCVYLLLGVYELFQPEERFCAVLHSDGWHILLDGGPSAAGRIPAALVSANEAAVFSSLKGAWAVSWIRGLLEGACLAGFLQALYRICFLCREEGRPFQLEIPGHIRRAAVWTAAGGFGASLLMGGLLPLFCRAVSVTPGVLGLESLLFGGALWLLSLIFEYGCRLQQDSDETL